MDRGGVLPAADVAVIVVAFEAELDRALVLDARAQGVLVGRVGVEHGGHPHPAADRVQRLKGRHRSTGSLSVGTVSLVGRLGVVEIELRQADDRVGQQQVLHTFVREGPRALLLIVEGLGNSVLAAAALLDQRPRRQAAVLVDIDRGVAVALHGLLVVDHHDIETRVAVDVGVLLVVLPGSGRRGALLGGVERIAAGGLELIDEILRRALSRAESVVREAIGHESLHAVVVVVGRAAARIGPQLLVGVFRAVEVIGVLLLGEQKIAVVEGTLQRRPVGLGSLLPAGDVVSGIAQRTGGVEQRAALHGQRRHAVGFVLIRGREVPRTRSRVAAHQPRLIENIGRGLEIGGDALQHGVY